MKGTVFQGPFFTPLFLAHSKTLSPHTVEVLRVRWQNGGGGFSLPRSLEGKSKRRDTTTQTSGNPASTVRQELQSLFHRHRKNLRERYENEGALLY